MTLATYEESSELSPAAKAAAPSRARLLRGAGVLLLGAGPLFLLAAHDGRLRLGVPLGAVLTAVAVAGVLDLVAAFRPLPSAAFSVSARALAPPLVRLALGCAGALLSLWIGVHAAAPQLVAGLALTGSVLAAIAALFDAGVALGALRFDEDGRERPLLRRQGFWLLAAMCLLDLPALGFGSLTDPWETHYGEVAREVLARDDWISLWWSWQGFFYSKPVLGTWAQSLAMATLGVGFAPGEMLHGVAGRLAHPEWAVRAPFVAFAMIGAYVLYKGMSRWVGRRAALLGGLALATSPQWFLVAHQSMTDMPYVASLSAAVGLVLLAARTADAALAPSYEIRFGGRALRVDAWHLVVAGVAACVLPQIVYLLSRNLELVLHASGPHGFRPHADEVHSGSGLGLCGSPGNAPCATNPPAHPLEPWLQAALWTALLVTFLSTVARERRTKRLLYLGAWLFAGLATMAKGPAGLVIPGACVFLWICATRRWSELTRAAAVSGLLLVALIVGPWFLAMYVRHGSPFTDELIFHDMFNRAMSHVHDTNADADTSLAYYLQQLGYALFPWTALAPVGLFALRGGTAEAREAATLCLLWFLVAFVLFSMMGTKFHHYILPAVPPAAMLAGLTVDALLTRTAEADRHERAMLAVAALGGALLLAVVGRDLVQDGGGGHVDGSARFMQLFTYRYDRPWPAALSMHGPIVAAAVTGAAALVATLVPRARRAASFAWVAVALAWAAWGLDVYLPRASAFWGQRSVIGAYYAERSGPSEPIAAYYMNWKGESFYTSNEIAQFGTPEVPQGTPSFASWVAEQRRKGTAVAYFVTERSRVGGLKNDVKPKALREVTTPADCEQFVLVRAEL